MLTLFDGVLSSLVFVVCRKSVSLHKSVSLFFPLSLPLFLWFNLPSCWGNFNGLLWFILFPWRQSVLMWSVRLLMRSLRRFSETAEAGDKSPCACSDEGVPRDMSAHAKQRRRHSLQMRFMSGAKHLRSSPGQTRRPITDTSPQCLSLFHSLFPFLKEMMHRRKDRKTNGAKGFGIATTQRVYRFIISSPWWCVFLKITRFSPFPSIDSSPGWLTDMCAACVGLHAFFCTSQLVIRL